MKLGSGYKHHVNKAQKVIKHKMGKQAGYRDLVLNAEYPDELKPKLGKSKRCPECGEAYGSNPLCTHCVGY